MSTAYLIVEDPDGARYAVPADSVQRHPGAVVIGREGDTGVPQPLEPEAAPEPETAPEAAPAPTPETAPEGVPAEQAPAPTETPETPAP